MDSDIKSGTQKSIKGGQILEGLALFFEAASVKYRFEGEWIDYPRVKVGNSRRPPDISLN